MLLDIGIGILSTIFITNIFNVEISYYLIIFGVVCSLLPDIDILFHLKSGKRFIDQNSYKHRIFLHYPIPYIIIGSLIIFPFSNLYASIFVIISILHFIHDSIGIGWGVQWLYPFTKKYYSFFYHYEIFRNNLPKKIIYSWTNEEINNLSEIYEDKDWVKNIYYKWHPYAITEFAVFIVSVICLYITLSRF